MCKKTKKCPVSFNVPPTFNIIVFLCFRFWLLKFIGLAACCAAGFFLPEEEKFLEGKAATLHADLKTSQNQRIRTEFLGTEAHFEIPSVV